MSLAKWVMQGKLEGHAGSWVITIAREAALAFGDAFGSGG